MTTENHTINQPEKQALCEACKGRGWSIFNTGSDGSPRYEIQRCDTCNRYEGDLAATEAVLKAAEQYPQLLTFAQNVSLQTHEGEFDADGEAYEPTSEDAIATLNQLIT